MPSHYQAFKYIPYDPIKIIRPSASKSLYYLCIIIMILLCAIIIICIVNNKKHRNIHKENEVEMTRKREIRYSIPKDAYPKLNLTIDSDE